MQHNNCNKNFLYKTSPVLSTLYQTMSRFCLNDRANAMIHDPIV